MRLYIYHRAERRRESIYIRDAADLARFSHGPMEEAIFLFPTVGREKNLKKRFRRIFLSYIYIRPAMSFGDSLSRSRARYNFVAAQRARALTNNNILSRCSQQSKSEIPKARAADAAG